VIVVATVYRPGPALTRFISDLRHADPDGVLVLVDDGSGPSAELVLAAAENSGATVLRHAVNRGKGVALKTAFAHVREAHPGCAVVCADPDGQHEVADVRQAAEVVAATGRIVLGVRRFDGDVPWRSRIGNVLTRRLFRAVTGRAVRDTQTGLRGYPGERLGWLLAVPGERFEYELNVLLYATRAGVAIEEIPIPTTYPHDKRSSHFSALTDSTRIYWAMLRFAVLRGAPGRLVGR
jgi:glycosyltransferase involved in cell wall biosynthesis